MKMKNEMRDAGGITKNNIIILKKKTTEEEKMVIGERGGDDEGIEERKGDLSARSLLFFCP